jgi:site-specific DNA recombinase
VKMQQTRQRQQNSTTVRCAMYIRKNPDEGTPDEFNDVPSQRKVIRSWIDARKSRGWVCLPKPYEDIGYSAGTLKRPALKRLLRDVAAGKIDCVVVHTLDRLIRSPDVEDVIVWAFRRYRVALVTAAPPPCCFFGGKKLKNTLPVKPYFPSLKYPLGSRHVAKRSKPK